MGGAAYRCDDCRAEANRCEACRARRAKANAARREAYREQGLCVMCGKKAKKGFTRCQHHLDLNAQHSYASWARAEAERKEAENA